MYRLSKQPDKEEDMDFKCINILAGFAPLHEREWKGHVGIVIQTANTVELIIEARGSQNR